MLQVASKHGFAFTPDDGRPDRIIRFTSEVNYPQGAVSLYDEEQNLLLVDTLLYEQLSYEQREQVLRTHCPMLFVEDLTSEFGEM